MFFDRCMHVVPLFICNDLKCIECNNYLQCSPINNFHRIGHRRKFIHIKNKRVKYSHNLQLGGLVKLLLQSGQNHQILHGFL